MGRPPKNQSETAAPKSATSTSTPVKKAAAAKLTAVKPVAPAPTPTPAKPTFFQRVKKFLHLK